MQVDPAQSCRNRFAVLATDRFRIYKPDALELRWTVFDMTTKRTVGYGQTPELAVDCAFDYCAREGVSLATNNYSYPSKV